MGLPIRRNVAAQESLDQECDDQMAPPHACTTTPRGGLFLRRSALPVRRALPCGSLVISEKSLVVNARGTPHRWFLRAYCSGRSRNGGIWWRRCSPGTSYHLVITLRCTLGIAFGRLQYARGCHPGAASVPALCGMSAAAFSAAAFRRRGARSILPFPGFAIPRSGAGVRSVLPSAMRWSELIESLLEETYLAARSRVFALLAFISESVPESGPKRVSD